MHQLQIEIDALAALEPDAFRDLVIDSVEQFFDKDIYEEVLKEYSEDDIKKILKSARQLARRL